jgi:GT2 family glycosyltransferase
LLRRCLDGLFHCTDYPNKEIIVVDNNSDDPETIDYLARLASAGRIRLLKYDAPFNFSAINNMAVSCSAGELVCLLNNDVEPINQDWLREMVSQAGRHEIGAVGAMLYYPDDTIQHAGVVLNGIVAGHLYAGFPKGYPGEGNRASLVQNLSAVTAACLVVRRELWDDVGGMDEENLTVAFNDVDFCLKVRQLGYRNLWTPFAELYHHESASRGREDTPEKLARVSKEIVCMQQRWGELLKNDPAWNPNLELDGAWPRPAHPPRSEKPWRGSSSPPS